MAIKDLRAKVYLLKGIKNRFYLDRETGVNYGLDGIETIDA